MNHFLLIKNLFKSITYGFNCLCCFAAKILINFYQKAVVFSETTYYYLRKLRMFSYCACIFTYQCRIYLVRLRA